MSQEPATKSKNTGVWFAFGGLIVALAIAAILIFNPFQKPSSSSISNTSSNTNQNNQNNQNTTPTTTKPNSSDPWQAQMDAPTRAILEKVVAAQGGLSALRKLKSMHWQGKTVTTYGTQIINSDTEEWIALPARVRQTSNASFVTGGKAVETTIAVDTDHGWLRGPQEDANKNLVEGIEDATSGMISNALQEITFDPLFSLLAVTESTVEFRYMGLQDVNGVQAHAISLSTPFFGTGTFYYDPVTFLPIKLHREGGGLTVDRLFQKYQKVDGYQLPFLQNNHIKQVSTASSGEATSVTTYSTIEMNVPISDDLFVKPHS
ncbi:hypothetical protein HY229_07230 [Candidatus Acetothermia bacterium]|nr:hypothetical protein [Candidatus Acetothermia bacterium]MBI3643871.1 hypothetical protein [Candidatus Acetothermia bacterium]